MIPAKIAADNVDRPIIRFIITSGLNRTTENFPETDQNRATSAEGQF
jgi:hypothetical protein